MEIVPKFSKSIRFFIIFSLSFYFLHLIFAILVNRAFFADGSNFFVNLLTQEKVWPVADDPKHIRLISNFINQFLTSLLIKLDVKNIKLLKISFNMGLFISPIIFYYYSFLLSKRAKDFRIFYCSFACLITAALPSEIFILNQSFTALAMVWVIIHYCGLNIELKKFDYVLVLIIGLALFRSHENMIFWGILITFISTIKIFKNSFKSKNSLFYLLIAALGILQSSFVFYWQNTRPVSAITDSYLNRLLEYLDLKYIFNGPSVISILITLSFISSLILSDINKRGIMIKNQKEKIFLTSCSILLFLSFCIGISSLFDFNQTNPFVEYNYRITHITLGSIFWIILSILIVLKNIKFDQISHNILVIILSVGLLSSTMWQFSNDMQWNKFSNAVSIVHVKNDSKFINPNVVKDYLEKNNESYLDKYNPFGWTWPVLGLSLQRYIFVEKIFIPDGFTNSNEWFDPPKRIPFVIMQGGDIDYQNSTVYDYSFLEPK